VIGEVDLAKVEEFRRHLDALVGQTPDGLVVDVAESTFVDVGAVDLLVVAGQRLMTGGGSLVVRSPPPILRRVLEIVGSDVILIED
jgi:anti-anti-sigma factor